MWLAKKTKKKKIKKEVKNQWNWWKYDYYSKMMMVNVGNNSTETG